MMERFLARKVIDDGGREYTLAVVTVHDSGIYDISPFVEETASTIYINGILVIGSQTPNKCTKIQKLCNNPEIWEYTMDKKA